MISNFHADDHGLLVIELGDEDRATLRDAARALSVHDPVRATENYVTEAQIQAARLSEATRRALLAFRRSGSDSGGLLVRGMPIDEVPETPTETDQPMGIGLPAAAVMSVLVATLGEQYGFQPEREGKIVQDVLPVAGEERIQSSISSDVRLKDHVEMAFSEYRADFVVLACLRPDHDRIASTTLASGHRALALLDADTVEVLRQQRFKTAVDESFLRSSNYSETIWIGPIAVLAGEKERPRLRVDFAETRSIDDDETAATALLALREAAVSIAIEVLLKTGDVLVVDNRHALHGRTPFRARGDGLDRWLLRTYLTRDLARSESVRPGNGRVIDTDYRTGPGVLDPSVDRPPDNTQYTAKHGMN
jgi:L-asparagine oxygenase